jgi:acetyl-CoA/propionyl-CoA carboxylase biotin carboxyl carrier protein
VRVDSGVRAGSVVGTEFDPMLAKVVASGPDRATAVRRLDRALAELELLGVATNAAFSRALLARSDVRAGELDTGLLERVLAELDAAPPEDLLPAAALVAAGTASPAGPWRRRFEGGEVRVAGGGVRAGSRSWPADVRRVGEVEWRIALDGVSRRYCAVASDEVVWVARDGHVLEARTERVARADAALTGSLEAPMPGVVLLVRVANGEAVTAGDVLLVLESMKMELSITAPHDGTVEGLALKAGDRVARWQPLVAVVPQ